MAYEPKEGSGALFRNDKGGVETRPDYRGDAMVNGAHVEIAGWLKDGSKGKFLSLSIKPKEQRGQPEPQGGGNGGRDLDDEIPFSACKE